MQSRAGSTGFAAIQFTETQPMCSQRLAWQHASERFEKNVAAVEDATERVIHFARHITNHYQYHLEI